MAERSFTRKGAEEVIRAADEIAGDARDRLTQSEVVTAAGEVGIPEVAIHAAVAAREAADASRDAALREKRARWRRVGRMARSLAGGAACGIAVIGAVLIGVANNEQEAYQHVEAARAAVDDAVERRAHIDSALATAINDGERASLVDRAEQRVYIARREYDVVAGQYNTEYGGFIGRAAAHFGTAPAIVPLATEFWRSR